MKNSTRTLFVLLTILLAICFVSCENGVSNSAPEAPGGSSYKEGTGEQWKLLEKFDNVLQNIPSEYFDPEESEVDGVTRTTDIQPCTVKVDGTSYTIAGGKAEITLWESRTLKRWELTIDGKEYKKYDDIQVYDTSVHRGYIDGVWYNFSTEVTAGS